MKLKFNSRTANCCKIKGQSSLSFHTYLHRKHSFKNIACQIKTIKINISLKKSQIRIIQIKTDALNT